MIKKLYDFVYDKQTQLSALILMLVSFVIFLQNEHPAVHQLQGIIAETLSPIKQPVVIFNEMQNARAKNTILSERIIQLSVEAARFNTLQEENDRFKELIKFQNSSRLNLLPALVISKGISQEVNAITINIGEDQGVAINSPVINIDGIVGKIFSVNKTTALAQIVTGPQFRISVKIKPDEATGILQWLGGNQFLIPDIPNTMNISKNNLVVTSGFSDMYPPDIPVGIVTDIEQATDGFTIRVMGDLLVNFNKINELFVLQLDNP